jgi:hypothetical protein
MILPIIIDTTSLMEQFTSLRREDVDRMCDNIAKGLAARFASKLEDTAKAELKQSRKRYINNIRVVDSGPLSGTVLLDYSKDKLIKMLEEGATAFDMKVGFLASPKVKVGKNGVKYLTIPFRAATPNAVGESDVFSSVMPRQIYNIVKKKDAVIDTPGGGKRSAGIALREIPEQFQTKKIRPAIVDNKGNELFKAYENKSSVHEGLFKQQDAATGQNTYRSFRRVSENSADEAWIHPGIERHNLIQKALGAFQTADEMTLLADRELEKLGLI